MTATPTPTRPREAGAQDFWARPAAAVLMIVTASTVVALLSPDMVTGSAHEHLPLAALTIWPWTASAVGYVVMAGRRGGSRDLVLGVAFIWVVVAVLALAVPTLVTGTDPTRIPLAALVAPPFGAITTGFLAIAHAGTPLPPRASSPTSSSS
jgi:hypothetical protein